MIDYDKFWGSGAGTYYTCGPSIKLHKDIILDIIKKHRISGKMLDAGCGDGFILSFLDKKENKLFGIDVSKKAIEIAKIKVPSCEFFVKDLSKKINLDKKFDLIICSHTLEHIKNEKIAIHNLISNLKIGGYLIINSPLNSNKPLEYGELHSYSKVKLIKLFSRKELKIIEKCSYGGPIYRIISEFSEKNTNSILKMPRKFYRVIGNIPYFLFKIEHLMLKKYNKSRMFLILLKRIA